MSHNVDASNGQDNIAFRGSRKDVWHHLGQQMQAGESVPAWATRAGLAHRVVAVPALADLTSAEFDHLGFNTRHVPVCDRVFLARHDTGKVLGHASARYQIVQPVETLEFMQRFASVDDRFEIDVAGSLRGGAIIWATATYKPDLTVAGDRHVARLLMTTTYDGSGATIVKGTGTRVVCNNTFDIAMADRRCEVRTRHSGKFDADKVAKQLADMCKGFGQFKAMGDAMATVEMSKQEVSDFFKALLDIPFDAKQEDISTQKTNKFRALVADYKITAAEGSVGTAWACLQAATRYVDHTRQLNRDASERFDSAQFGSGAGIKAKAFGLLLPLIKDKVAA